MQVEVSRHAKIVHLALKNFLHKKIIVDRSLFITP